MTTRRGTRFGVAWLAIVLGVGCQRTTTSGAVGPVAAPMASGSAVAAKSPDEIRFCTDSVFLRPKGWQCVGEVTPAIAQKRHHIIRSTLRDGRVVRDELVNGRGFPTDADWAALDYTYDEAGNLREEATVDKYGIVRSRLRFSADGKRAERLDAWRQPAVDANDPDGDFLVALHDYDARGLRARTTYFDGEGKKRHAHNGAHEARLTYAPGSFGAHTYQAFGEDGQPMDDRDGDHRSVTTRAIWGPTERHFFSRDGSPSLSAGRRTGFRQSFDAIGNPQWWEELDENGAAFDNKGRHVAREVNVHDEHGDRVEVRFLRTDGSPFIGNYSMLRRTFDERGRVKTTAYLDGAGAPTTTGPVALEERDYDEAGALTEQRFFRADGSPGRGKQGKGWVRTTCKYDARHNEIETRHWAADGSPGADDDGISAIARRFHRDRLVEIERRGRGGQLFAHQGVARITLVRDATGAIVERRFDDARDEAVQAFDLVTFRIGYAGSRRPIEGITRSRDEARALAERLLAEIRAGRSMYTAAAKYADFSEAKPEIAIAESVLYPELREALQNVPAGGTTGIVDAPNGFLITRRLR